MKRITSPKRYSVHFPLPILGGNSRKGEKMNNSGKKVHYICPSFPVKALVCESVPQRYLLHIGSWRLWYSHLYLDRSQWCVLEAIVLRAVLNPKQARHHPPLDLSPLASISTFCLAAEDTPAATSFTLEKLSPEPFSNVCKGRSLWYKRVQVRTGHPADHARNGLE